MPSRTTKLSEKLVLLPETDQRDDDAEEEAESESVLARRLQDEENRPLRDEELDVLKKRGGIRGKSYAERLPKVQRKDKVSRLTAYCTAQAFKIEPTSEFLRQKHEAKTKLYDDCLYVIYALPLLNGTEGYRVRGRPMLKTPGTGKTMLDLEIERSERRYHHEGYFEDDAYTAPESPERGTRSPASFGILSSDDETRLAPDEGVHSQINRLAP
ncbi:sporulation protein rmd8, partial [Lasius niger]